MPSPTDTYAPLHSPLLGRRQTLKNEPRFLKPLNHVAFVICTVLASNYVNVLLVFAPLGTIAGAMKWNPTLTFVLNFIAIIPLAALLSFATEQLSARLGQTLGGLMNATFGNAVELIVSNATEAPTYLLSDAGLHRCAEAGRDPHCAIEHAGQHSVQYLAGEPPALPPSTTL